MPIGLLGTERVKFGTNRQTCGDISVLEHVNMMLNCESIEQ